MTQSRGTSDVVNQDMILGEMRGQLREVVHSMNNLTQKFDSLTREVIGLAILGPKVADLEMRMMKLETVHDRQNGAMGVIEMIMKSPLVGWFVGLASVGFAIAKGWIQIP